MEEITYRLSYQCRHGESRDTIMDLDVGFDNPTDEVLQKRINTWLTAIGVNLEVVSKN
ncbi:hypothetical protein [Synechococcus phage DSL-LC02]|nr:hypothetical protein [Synechococcus phage DSL-LC02]